MLNPDDEDDFVQAIIQSQGGLRTFILTMTPSKSEADDVLQEVNLALWKKRHLYKPDKDFLRWALGFATVQIRRLRSKSVEKKIWFNDSLLETIAEEWPQNFDVIEQKRDALTYCIKKLNKTEHQFISKFYGGEHSAKKLADISGKPLSTVYKVLTRARENLRICVKNLIAQQA